MKIATANLMGYRDDDPAAGAVTVAPGQAACAPQVIVVDDSQVIRELVVWLLRVSGYRAIAAENGYAAQMLLKTERPALLITDLNMPLARILNSFRRSYGHLSACKTSAGSCHRICGLMQNRPSEDLFWNRADREKAASLRGPQKVDGWELLTFCHRHRPEMPVLIVSGEGLGKRPEVERWASGFLAKAFDFGKFRFAVDHLVSCAVN